MDILDKVLKIQPHADAKTEELEVQKMLDSTGQYKTHTTHFKMTRTLEVEQTQNSDDETVEHGQVVNEKKKHRGCFAGCFKKKKG